MGYLVSARVADRGGSIEVVESLRVGVYGSQDVLVAMLFAGYAQGRFTHSDRVRGSWVRPLGGCGRVLPADAGAPSGDPRTRAGFASWVRFNYDNRAWLEPAPEAVALGRKFKPVTCPTLTGLLGFYDRYNDFSDPGGGSLSPGDTAALAAAVTGCLPGLVGSCWYPLVVDFAAVCSAAATAGGSLHYG